MEQEERMTDCSSGCQSVGQSVCPSAEANRETWETRFRTWEHRLSFPEAFAMAARQMDAAAFVRLERLQGVDVKPLVEVVLRCMADVYAAWDGNTVRIGGNELPCRDVQNVYLQLGADDLWPIVEKLREVDPKSPRVYVQTVLHDRGLVSGYERAIDWDALAKSVNPEL